MTMRLTRCAPITRRARRDVPSIATARSASELRLRFSRITDVWPEHRFRTCIRSSSGRHSSRCVPRARVDRVCGDVVSCARPNIRSSPKRSNYRWIAPRGSRLAYQQWIVPKSHEHDLNEPREIASLLQSSARAMRSISDSFNWAFITFPHQPRGHWYVELFPRMAMIAGYRARHRDVHQHDRIRSTRARCSAPPVVLVGRPRRRPQSAEEHDQRMPATKPPMWAK